MRSITIQNIQLHIISLELVEPLTTSYGVEADKSAIIVELTTSSGIAGWGEVSAMIAPGYGPETIATADYVIRQFIIPLLNDKTIENPTDVPPLLRSVRGHHHAKAGVEAAVWDAFAKANDLRLTDLLTVYLPDDMKPRDAVAVGVSIGIQPSIEETRVIIRKRLAQGYQRIKLKIKRGWDLELARGVREVFPDIMLMLDANSDYTLDNADHLAQFDNFDLLMIEQPLSYDDVLGHSVLQQRLKTPICLDESITSANDLRLALHINALEILNLKPARVGGLSESLRICALCATYDVPLWIGGMLETGIGRAVNVALAALPVVSLPSDISATDRYFATDITEPDFKLQPNSTLLVPEGYGIGLEVDRATIDMAATRWRKRQPFHLQ